MKNIRVKILVRTRKKNLEHLKRRTENLGTYVTSFLTFTSVQEIICQSKYERACTVSYQTLNYIQVRLNECINTTRLVDSILNYIKDQYHLDIN